MYKLDQIAVKISGNFHKLLDGTVSNNLDAKYNAFLDRSGKIVATFYQILSEDSITIVIGKKFYERLMEHLDKYLKLIKCEITKLDFKIYFDETDTKTGEYTILLDLHRIILTNENFQELISTNEFNKFRVENNIILQGIDFDSDMVLNISEKYVSFSKGCYLGQEVVARIHNLAKPPRKLTSMFEDELNEEVRGELTSKVEINGRVKGFCLVKNQEMN